MYAAKIGKKDRKSGLNSGNIEQLIMQLFLIRVACKDKDGHMVAAPALKYITAALYLARDPKLGGIEDSMRYNTAKRM